VPGRRDLPEPKAEDIDMFNHTIGAIRRWQARERARRELSALDDRQLADIGLHRANIDAVVSGARRSAAE
jgi:uncharacterized protein YjiS (DUF1127 family)